jgi:hypothetical protein
MTDPPSFPMFLERQSASHKRRMRLSGVCVCFFFFFLSGARSQLPSIVIGPTNICRVLTPFDDALCRQKDGSTCAQLPQFRVLFVISLFIYCEKKSVEAHCGTWIRQRLVRQLDETRRHLPPQPPQRYTRDVRAHPRFDVFVAVRGRVFLVRASSSTLIGQWVVSSRYA